MSFKTHQAVHLQLATPRVGPASAIDATVDPGSATSASCPAIVHAEGESLVVVCRCDCLLLEGGEVPVDAERRAERRVKCRAVRHQHSVEEGLQGAVWLTLDLVEDMRGLH